MGYYKNLSGKRFGKLTVLERIGINSNRHYVIWRCICDCGNIKLVASGDLIRGSNGGRSGVRSCGCLRNIAHRRYSFGEASFNSVFNKLKSASKKRGIFFNLSKENVRIISKQNCFYCGDEPSNKNIGKGYYGEYVYSGIDRINSDIGYVVENVVPCCKKCNLAKRDMTTKEFKEWITRVYKNYAIK